MPGKPRSQIIHVQTLFCPRLLPAQSVGAVPDARALAGMKLYFRQHPICTSVSVFSARPVILMCYRPRMHCPFEN